MGILKKGKYTNRKDQHYFVDEHGRFSNTEPLEEFLNRPNVKRQLDGFHRMYMQQTLMALYNGKEPPNSAGGYGILTKKKLMSIWDKDWQTELDTMNEYYDVTYNSFFNIPTNGDAHPPAGILLTANEITETYGSKEEKS